MKVIDSFFYGILINKDYYFYVWIGVRLKNFRFMDYFFWKLDLLRKWIFGNEDVNFSWMLFVFSSFEGYVVSIVNF